MGLNDIICRNAKPKEKEYKLADGEGMYLLIKTNGTKCWRLKYRIAGKERQLAMGTYPHVSLVEARKKRSAARDLIETGTDPSQAKKQEKKLSAIKIQNNFGAIAREWHENNKHTWTEKHAHNILKRLEKNIFPDLGKRPITEISSLELLDTIRKIEKRGAHVLAHRAVKYCNKVFRYAILTSRADRNPALDLAGALKPAVGTHFAALDRERLTGLLTGLRTKRRTPLSPNTSSRKILAFNLRQNQRTHQCNLGRN